MDLPGPQASQTTFVLYSDFGKMKEKRETSEFVAPLAMATATNGSAITIVTPTTTAAGIASLYMHPNFVIVPELTLGVAGPTTGVLPLSSQRSIRS